MLTHDEETGAYSATPRGEIGEIWVKGPCLAIGYYRAPEQTDKVFMQNPLNNEYPERIYNTGDIGHIGEDGNLYFHGRKDRQIKHMGHRVELAELEAELLAVPELAGARPNQFVRAPAMMMPATTTTATTAMTIGTMGAFLGGSGLGAPYCCW